MFRELSSRMCLCPLNSTFEILHCMTFVKWLSFLSDLTFKNLILGVVPVVSKPDKPSRGFNIQAPWAAILRAVLQIVIWQWWCFLFFFFLLSILFVSSFGNPKKHLHRDWLNRHFLIQILFHYTKWSIIKYFANHS